MEMQEKKLVKIKNTLDDVCQFLHDYLPLANTHTTDFIVAGQWQCYVPPSIADELLSLSPSELAHLPSGKLFISYPEEKGNVKATKGNTGHWSSVKSPEAVEFTQLHCQKSLSVGIYNKCKDNQEGDGSRSTCSLPPCDVGTDLQPSDRLRLPRDQLPRWSHKDLESFVFDARQHSLPGLGVTTEWNQVLFGWNHEEREKLVISNIMSAKKSHEVEVMADICAKLTKHYKINQVVDIGSGKGYLGSQLALMHSLPVLGIDSSCTNTSGATMRTQRLAKHWDGLIRNAKEDLEMGIPIKRGKNYRGKQRKKEAKANQVSSLGCDINPANSVVVDDGFSDIAAIFSQSDLHCEPKETNSRNDVGGVGKAKSHEGSVEEFKVTAETREKLNHRQRQDTKIDQNDKTLLDSLHYTDLPRENREMKVNVSNHQRPKVLKKHIEKEQKNELGNKEIMSNFDSSLYIPLTQFVTSETNILELLAENSVHPAHSPVQGEDGCLQNLQSKNNCATDSPVLLTGLHACGNLTSSMLRLFINNPCVRAICNVGCCYNHLDEEFVRGPFEADDAVFTEFGFPLSSYLCSRHYQLGRNARMLAAQSPDRMAHENKVSQQALFWRAVLQVLLCDLTGEVRDDWHVGRIATKCENFTQYVHKALAKLGIEHKLCNEDIQQYEESYSIHEARLMAFFQLRASLGPCIEALILLDRLVFLLEQDCVADAHLIQMFDPVTSPRCYGLIAMRQ